MSSNFTLPELKKIARRMDISTSGTKKQLYDRINRHLKQHGGRVVSRRKRKSILPQRKSHRKSKKQSRKRSRRSRSRTKSRKRSYFKRGHTLTEPHEKYCRCVLHVADKQTSECLREKKWNQRVNGKQCYNPYSTCTASTKRTGSPECTKNLNLYNIPKNELKALLDIKKMSLTQLRKKYDL